MGSEWLSKHAPGFHELTDQERSAISDFTFLWSLFEARIMDGFARSDGILQKVDEWNAANILAIELYQAELAYFQDRYFSNGHFTYHYDHLHLRERDHCGIVRSVLDGSNNSDRDCLIAVLMIVWRFRNNLFHGAKWENELKDQLSNFTHANSVLKKTLELHGDLPL